MSNTQSIAPVPIDQIVKATSILHQRTIAPKFGHDLLPYFSFKRGYLNLNNGSYGALPKVVTEACNELMAWQEENTDFYYRIGFIPPLIGVREQLAKLVGASDVDELVMVANASTGLGVVLRNFLWESGDVIIRCNTTYATVYKTIQYIHDVTPGVQISEFQLAFPTTYQAILDGWKKHIDNVKQNAPPGKKIVAVIDSIVANPAAAMPWKEMVKICKDAKIWTIVDGAHSVGQEELKLADCGADFFVSNCHKWLNSKRGAAFLWMPKESQKIMLTTIPTSASYVTPGPDRPDTNIVSQFQYNGTIDYTTYLSVHVALQWREWVGGEAAIHAYCNNLAKAGGKLIAQTMNTQVMDPDGEFTKAMVNVTLPFPSDFQAQYDASVGTALSNKLLAQNMYAVTYYHNNIWWTRVSAQIWNELDDFKILGNALVTICSEIVAEHKHANVPGNCKASSFESYLQQPIKGAVALDLDNALGAPKPVTTTKVVPVGYHTQLASIRP
ncbi:pyridoxal phosphate-dependent transferase [Lentinula guzmanii]|uniref:Pyridoxal phosphate-dependent transferase n=1 Tax=Lentinula guzmanii TaxID=2804957 RepID=A0AA38J802_9AGAR|nr:pyridoxal phosphate-dependent transferase [Lentinula guzmanii]